MILENGSAVLVIHQEDLLFESIGDEIKKAACSHIVLYDPITLEMLKANKGAYDAILDQVFGPNNAQLLGPFSLVK